MMKLRHRLLAIVACLFVGLFVIFLFDSQLRYMSLPVDSNEVHGKSHFILHRKFLNREETSKVSSELNNVNHVNLLAPPTAKPYNMTTMSSTTEVAKDMFWDLFPYTVFGPNWRSYMEWPPRFTLSPREPTLKDVLHVRMRPNMTNWEKFHLQISKYHLYPENSQVVKGLLHDMATQRITGVEQLPGGTQLKLVITFENGGKALFKPMRFPREVETLPNHFYFTDYERHVSEIASYHLDRILGFRRAPPVVGRTVNITEELYPLAPPELFKTFFVSPAGNVCFHGQCTYYCDTGHAFCGNPDTIEGSLAAWLPPKNILDRRPLRSPWRRSYNKRRKAAWEGNDYYCIKEVKNKPPYNHGRRLYDAIDCAIFDFLTGNMDRHHYDEITTFGNDSTIIHWDHGRGFGRANHDEMSIIVPLLQCCVIRLSTFNKLYEFHLGPKHLSDIMRESLAEDPVAPVLLEQHLLALDRRVAKVLESVRQCLMANKPDLVFLDDM